jgi:hypothetical protein
MTSVSPAGTPSTQRQILPASRTSAGRTEGRRAGTEPKHRAKTA